MQSSSPDVQSSSPDRIWARLGPILRVVAEAGFFTVLYATLSVTLEGQRPLLGPIEITALVGLGALVGRFARPNPELGAIVLVAAVLGAGIACWLASPVARSLLPDHLGPAMITHGIGWLGAFAVLRGSVIRGESGEALHLDQLLRALLPFVALLWAVATLFAPRDLWLSFAPFALWGSLAVIVAGLAGIGMVRLNALHAGPIEGRVRRTWRWLVVAAAVLVVPLSVPFVALAGLPVGVLFEPFVGPLLFVIGIIVIPAGWFIDALVTLLTPFASNLAQFLDELAQRFANVRRAPSEAVEPSLLTTLIGIAIATIVVTVLAYSAYALARWLLSRPEDEERVDDPVGGVIEHAIVVPEHEPARPRPGLVRRRRGAAHDAVTAYVTAVDELAAYPAYARLASETPAEHSLRLRAAGMPASVDLALLAADYQLARYAERRLTPREDRRALSRLDRLRRLLRGR